MIRPFLRQPPFGDVDVRHDLQSRDQGGLDVVRHLIDLVQNPVDAEPDPHVALGGFEMEIGCTRLDRLLEKGVHVPHQRSVVAAARHQVGHIGQVLGAHGAADRIQVVVLALEPIDQFAQFAAGDDNRADEHAGGRAHVVQGHHVVGIADRDDQFVTGDGDAQQPMPQYHRERDPGRGGGLDGVANEAHAGEAVRVGQCPGQTELGDERPLEQDFAERTPSAFSSHDGLLDVGSVDAAARERVKQWAVDLVHVHSPRRSGLRADVAGDFQDQAALASWDIPAAVDAGTTTVIGAT